MMYIAMALETREQETAKRLLYTLILPLLFCLTFIVYRILTFICYMEVYFYDYILCFWIVFVNPHNYRTEFYE